jgi:transcriptional regulator with XRE-family HTH domain
MTQNELAKILKASQSAVSNWLRGSQPRVKTARLLAKKFPGTEAWEWLDNPSRMVRRALDGKIKPKG